jgi:hypothetical protein
MTASWDFPFDSLVSLDRLAAGTNQERSAATPIVGKITRRSYFEASSMPRYGRSTPLQIATPLDLASWLRCFVTATG